jgi:SHS2 domain-containing protein
MNGADFEELDHTADAALRIHGRTLAALFTNAARGLIALITGARREKSGLGDIGTYAVPGTMNAVPDIVEIHATGTDELLHGWLSELLFLMATRRILLIDCIVEEIDEGVVRARVFSVPLTEELSREIREIKAVTWHGLGVLWDGEGYTAEVVFDL